MKFIVAVLFSLLLAACASPLQTPEQRIQQRETLLRNESNSTKLATGLSTVGVQEFMGVATSRTKYLSDSGETELWRFPVDAGWLELKFLNGGLAGWKVQRTAYRFARDTSLPLTDRDKQLHTALALLKLGWSVQEAESLPVRPNRRYSEQETVQAYYQLASLLARGKDLPAIQGFDFDLGSFSPYGSIWVYEADRLSGALFIQQSKITRITLSEKPTRAQEAEMDHRAF